MPLSTVCRTFIAGVLGVACVHGAARGGQETQIAYHNFPAVPSDWYATGCCSGAIIADDIETAPGTEGMQLAEIRTTLYAVSIPAQFTLLVFHHNDATGLPGQFIASKQLPELPAIGTQEVSIDVWSLNISVPASRRLWIAVYAPTGLSGWTIAGTEPSIGASGNFYARNPGDGFVFSSPVEEIEFMNLMLRVDVATDPCPADTNGDNVVDVTDMIEVVLNWNCTDPPGPCPGDVNADGIVNVQDLIEIILAWGNCFDV